MSPFSHRIIRIIILLTCLNSLKAQDNTAAFYLDATCEASHIFYALYDNVQFNHNEADIIDRSPYPVYGTLTLQLDDSLRITDAVLEPVHAYQARYFRPTSTLKLTNYEWPACLVPFGTNKRWQVIIPIIAIENKPNEQEKAFDRLPNALVEQLERLGRQRFTLFSPPLYFSIGPAQH